MIVKLFQIFDTTAMQVGGPIMAAARAEAVIREFREVLASPNTTPGKYPEDFVLLEIGEQNISTGELTPCDPKTIDTGRVWLRMKERASADNPDSSSPANTNGAGEQPSGFITKDSSQDKDDAERRLLEFRNRAVSR